MKLKGKMQLIIGALVVVSLMLVGIVASQFSYSAIIDTVKDSTKTSTDLASDEISAMLGDYMNITTVTGMDPTLASATVADSVKGDRIDTLAAKYGFTSGNILDKDGVSLKDGTDFHDRDYVIKALAGETNVSDITLSKYTNTYGFSVAAPLVSASGDISGVVYYRMDIDFMQAITESINISKNSYAYIVDGTGTVIVHPDTTLISEFNIAKTDGSLGKVSKDILSGEDGDTSYTYNGQEVLCGYAPIEGTNGWTVVIAAPVSDFQSLLVNSIVKIMGVVAILTIITIIIAGTYAKLMAKEISEVAGALEKIAEGDFKSEVKETKKKDEIGILTNSAASLQKTLNGIIGEANAILAAISSYDLTSNDMRAYPGDFNSLAVAVNQIQSILRGLIVEVKESANCVGVGSKELADAAESLSQGTVVQANSIQVVAEDVADMAVRIANTSGNEDKVNNQLKVMGDQIQTGNDDMTKLLAVVKEVESMSNDIQKIVGTIDSIAFQTNILALNAAVEAASAGEHGKGFAVVADEIGNLANKCSDSSKQTEELINKCIDKIKQAKECADATFDCLSNVVASSDEISAAFEVINKDTTEQAARSANVQKEVNNISDVIQNNTAAAAETAAASETLSEQAMNLNDLILQFRL